MGAVGVGVATETLGARVLGTLVGLLVGRSVPVGTLVGLLVGTSVPVGTLVGLLVGTSVPVGTFVGRDVGAGTGGIVGNSVGAMGMEVGDGGLGSNGALKAVICISPKSPSPYAIVWLPIITE